MFLAVITVGHVGTGNAGAMALRHLIEDPRFELTGVCVSTPAKVGRDAGELAGIEARTGVAAVGDLDALIATRPQVVFYAAIGETRFFEAVADVQKLLEAGIHVVGTSPVTLLYPYGVLPDMMIDPLREACEQHGVSLHVAGVDPGFANDVMPLVLASTCRTVHQVKCSELADYATYDGVAVMHDVMGFGQPLDETPMLLKPGVLAAGWGVTMRQLAAGLGIELTEIREAYERDPAPHDIEVSVGTIAQGTQAGLWFEVAGMVGEHKAIVVEHVTRTYEGQRPDWASPGQEGGSYRVEITGEPSYTVEICPTSQDGDHNYAAILVGVGRAVNAIPAVVAAEPGIHTALDLPMNLAGTLTVPAATEEEN